MNRKPTVPSPQSSGAKPCIDNVTAQALDDQIVLWHDGLLEAAHGMTSAACLSVERDIAGLAAFRAAMLRGNLDQAARIANRVRPSVRKVIWDILTPAERKPLIAAMEGQT